MPYMEEMDMTTMDIASGLSIQEVQDLADLQWGVEEEVVVAAAGVAEEEEDLRQSVPTTECFAQVLSVTSVFAMNNSLLEETPDVWTRVSGRCVSC